MKLYNSTKISKPGNQSDLRTNIRRMASLALVFSLFLIQVSAKSRAQITYSQKGATISRVFKEIRKQAGVDVFWQSNVLNDKVKINAQFLNAPLEEVLTQCIAGQDLVFTIKDKTVILTKKEAAVSADLKSAFSRMEITGTIFGEKEETLPGVNVMNKKTGKVVTSDANGVFKIAASPNDELLFSSLGYISQTIVVTDKTSKLTITLVPSSIGLENVIVVGYGVQKKVNVTGSVASVGAKELENRPVTNVSNALQGTMAGVTVTQSNGQPGKDAGKINIRGIGTLGGTNPMVIVDGIISSMDNVNPNDIDNISVLKDAASASIYGSRASNGVILITTKKGKAGTSVIHYNAYLGKQKPTNLPDYLPSWDAAALYNLALKNEGKPLRYTDAEIQKFRDGSDPFNYPNTDWLGLFYKGNGIQQNHYLDVSGGTEKTQYMVSLGYFDENGLVKGTNTNKYTSRINLTTQATKGIKINANLGFINSTMQEPANPFTGDFAQVIRQINRISPMVPYKYANGNYGYISDGNPMAWLEGGSFNREKYYNLLGNVGADLTIIEGLHFKPTVGYQLNIDQNKKFIKDQQYYDKITGAPSFYQGPNSLKDYNEFLNVVTLQALLQYDKTFGKHTIGALAGYSEESNSVNVLEGYRKRFLNNSLSEINAGPIDGQTTAGYANELALRSGFGRINYSFDSRYLLEANLRYDATSRFAPLQRWGAFPSFSAGWRISQEAFFAPVKSWVNELKLRGSWGKLGNQSDIANYPYISTINTGLDYVFGGTAPAIAPGVAVVNGANEKIKWESATTTGIGLDAGIYNNKLTLSVDYFNKKTGDILLSLPIGEVYGLVPPVQNAGSVKNSGWEFMLTYHDVKGDFSYGANLNASFIKNEITDLHGIGPIISGATFRQVGYPIDGFYGYISDGIFQTKAEVDAHATQSGGTIAPGDLKYRDLNGDGVINGSDRTYLGSRFPKATFGINLNAAWKGFDLTVFLQGAADVKNYVQGIMLGQVSSSTGKPTSALLDSWTPENTDATFPRLWTNFRQNDPSGMPSSYWIRDASYQRMKNLQLGYTLPEKYVKRIGLSRARIYYSGQNLFTITNFYKWVDPEAPRGDNGYTYPQVLVNSIGLNITF
ncbi:TonB-linked outer membrane protein, SusC/RagA family [Pedobacter steynii]|uniref:TonB-linked outer membrane protein, SusC/RagA family n=1 Tax=Pedobacter steynii TaxID=430522 RepID=A0A1H0CLE6_9SPHI|nr:TonB-dependent receptor [Pedobacter steynii]NQX41599.1 TonB-dependent receptor [Pedobacter steynii]SDN58601.1 TonB-linked outer membrane protein, SusC/RagA family [Pedobacter steynii]